MTQININMKTKNDNFRSLGPCWYAGEVIWMYEFMIPKIRLSIHTGDDLRGDESSSAKKEEESPVPCSRVPGDTFIYFISIPRKTRQEEKYLLRGKLKTKRTILDGP